jgi:hypothetical protein
VDFINLNRCLLKDNYPLHKMDHILQRVVISHKIFMLNGYSRYNQISVLEEDKEKTAFTTSWGTFMYDKILFGLMNAGATFQRAMDIEFLGEKDTCSWLYIFMDITIFSKSNDEHLQHLEKIFQKCRRYGISLNPQKITLFYVRRKALMPHYICRGDKDKPIKGICNL